MISIGHFIQKQQISLFSLVRKKQNPGKITSWGHKLSLGKFKKSKTKNISSIFFFLPQCCKIRYELQEKTVKKIINTGRLNNMLLNSQEFTEDLKEGKAKKENTTQNLQDSVKPVL